MGYTINRARESIYSFDQPYVNLRYVREWPGGWITGIGMKASWIEYKDKEPFFGVTRSEREIRFEADVLNRRIRLWRLTPRFLVGYVDRASNLDLYTWKRTYVRLGMTAEF
jgi:outer membrane protein